MFFYPAPTKGEQPKVSPSLKYGIFLGYELHPGGRWSGRYLVADIDDFKWKPLAIETHYSEFNIKPHKAWVVNMVRGFPDRLIERLREALGTAKDYRLFGGLLQYRRYSQSSGIHEWFTVIPMGNWRTVQFGADTRRLSLRRYIILVFHQTAMGPHRGRERTLQAILGAGCW